MPIENEGVPTPKDADAIKALAELEKEGAEVEAKAKTETPEPKKEEPKVEVKEEIPIEPKPDRPHSMVEAWKLKVAEDQKQGLTEKVTELESKLVELSKKSEVTQTQKDDITEEIKSIAEEAGVDAGFLTKFADSILKKAESRFKPSEDVAKTIQGLTEERELAKQERAYSQEFEKDIEPLVKEKYQLSDTALSQLKSQLKNLAFSETYAKVPLTKILLAEEESLTLTNPKKSSEGKGIKSRQEVVDLDNLDEEKFKNLSDEQVEKLAKSKSEGVWVRR